MKKKIKKILDKIFNVFKRIQICFKYKLNKQKRISKLKLINKIKKVVNNVLNNFKRISITFKYKINKRLESFIYWISSRGIVIKSKDSFLPIYYNKHTFIIDDKKTGIYYWKEWFDYKVYIKKNKMLESFKYWNYKFKDWNYKFKDLICRIKYRIDRFKYWKGRFYDFFQVTTYTRTEGDTTIHFIEIDKYKDSTMLLIALCILLFILLCISLCILLYLWVIKTLCHLFHLPDLTDFYSNLDIDTKHSEDETGTKTKPT